MGDRRDGRELGLEGRCYFAYAHALVEHSISSPSPSTGYYIPVAVFNAILNECCAALASDKTLFCALAIVLLCAVCAANAEAKTRELCAACEAAAPESVWPATSDEMMAALWRVAAALALLAAAIRDAACLVASAWLGWAEARAVRPATRSAVTRMLIYCENTTVSAQVWYLEV